MGEERLFFGSPPPLHAVQSPVPLLSASPYHSCPSINSSVVKLMDAPEIPPKEPLPAHFLPAPLSSSRMEGEGALSSPKYGLFILSAREPRRIKEGASERPILIAAERERSGAPSSAPSHQSPPPNPWPPWPPPPLPPPTSPLLLFLDRSDRRRCCMVLYCPMPCSLVLPFSDKIEREEKDHRAAVQDVAKDQE